MSDIITQAFYYSPTDFIPPHGEFLVNNISPIPNNARGVYLQQNGTHWTGLEIQPTARNDLFIHGSDVSCLIGHGVLKFKPDADAQTLTLDVTGNTSVYYSVMGCSNDDPRCMTYVYFREIPAGLINTVLFDYLDNKDIRFCSPNDLHDMYVAEYYEEGRLLGTTITRDPFISSIHVRLVRRVRTDDLMLLHYRAAIMALLDSEKEE